jgi:predicted nucleic acid-binding protein
MIVVSDTSSINYLVILGYIEVLPRLFGTVIIPTEVYEELLADETPEIVREWIKDKPDWLEIRNAKPLFVSQRIHIGESAAIGLALEIQSDTVLIDDERARSFARFQGLAVTGTVGVLERAHQQGMLDLTTALAELQATSFFITAAFIQSILARNP